MFLDSWTHFFFVFLPLYIKQWILHQTIKNDSNKTFIFNSRMLIKNFELPHYLLQIKKTKYLELTPNVVLGCSKPYFSWFQKTFTTLAKSRILSRTHHISSLSKSTIKRHLYQVQMVYNLHSRKGRPEIRLCQQTCKRVKCL